ncbi:hypothetical protein [Devosia nitrariae]|uniref:Prepilin type IV endopeptidase peptidase domain-containing protein n=1 Tax=Devosia nitrariae TaxID=2071872 RepID=A0ABQ5VZS5_9HYPH|nr:hypothetical protein [Devosia nitrariae]GLQ53054.1 hypothetical protein GCM10010862_03120 [Devosia nitrariae]
MFAPDWIVLGLTALVLAVVAAGAVSTLLAWRMPMTPLAPALVAGGTGAGLVLMVGGVLPVLVLLAGGGLAAIAGFFYDRALVGQWTLAAGEAAVAAATLALIPGLMDLHVAMGVEWPGLALPIATGIAVALVSLGLRRADRSPGLPAAIGACAAAVAVFLAVWSRIAEPQPAWWLAILALLLVGFSIISRSRAAPFGAAGTSYLALTIPALVAVIAVAGPVT